MAIVAQLVRRYEQYFDKRPVVTMMITNSVRRFSPTAPTNHPTNFRTDLTTQVLNGIADTVAQSVTAIRRNAAFDPTRGDIELDVKLDQKLPHYGDELVPTHSSTHMLPPPFDFGRLVRFASWGFIIAPFQFRWLRLLQKTFPITATSATLPALKRMACDQIFFAPLGLVGFFSYMTYAEGGDTQAVKKRLGNVFVPTIKANYMLWPAVQLLNFRVMPLQYQLPFASTVGIAWGTYLSLTNSSAEP